MPTNVLFGPSYPVGLHMNQRVERSTQVHRRRTRTGHQCQRHRGPLRTMAPRFTDELLMIPTKLVVLAVIVRVEPADRSREIVPTSPVMVIVTPQTPALLRERVPQTSAMAGAAKSVSAAQARITKATFFMEMELAGIRNLFIETLSFLLVRRFAVTMSSILRNCPHGRRSLTWDEQIFARTRDARSRWGRQDRVILCALDLIVNCYQAAKCPVCKAFHLVAKSSAPAPPFGAKQRNSIISYFPLSGLLLVLMIANIRNQFASCQAGAET